MALPGEMTFFPSAKNLTDERKGGSVDFVGG